MACGTGSGGSGGNGSSIQIWEGYTSAEAKAFAHLLSEYDHRNPGHTVTSLYVNNDTSLQKVLTAVRGGSAPDIAYLYGSWAPNVAQIPQVVTLNSMVRQPAVNWADFWAGERDVATVHGRVIGVPALVDNLAVVYNKTLLRQAGLQPPGPGWTWQQFAADAKKLTDPAKKQYGTAYVTPGSEDTVWHWEALLWEAGGQILTPDNKKAAFDSAAGLQSLKTLQQMAVSDHSVYLDPTDQAYSNLFNSGKIGMLVTGPWDLAVFPNVHYGVQIMPSFPGSAGGHQTISGPDNWVIFNNGSAPGEGGGEVPAVAHRSGAGEVLLAGHRGSPDPRVSRQRPGVLRADEQGTARRELVHQQPGQRRQARPHTAQLPEDLPGARQHDRFRAARPQPARGGAGQRRAAGQPDSRQPERVTWQHPPRRSAAGA